MAKRHKTRKARRQQQRRTTPDRSRAYYTALRGTDLGLDKIDLAAEGRRAHATIEVLVDEVSALMAPYDAFDVVANLYLNNAPLNPDEYKESTHKGHLVIPEYAALLLLSRGRREGNEPAARLIPGPTIEACNERIRSILQLVSLEIMGRLATLDDKQLATLQYSQLSKELFIRNPSFPHQEEATLKQLFGSDVIAEALRKPIGFDATDALALYRAMSEWQASRLANEIAMAHRMRSDALAGPLDEGYGHVRGVVEEMRSKVPRKKFAAEVTRLSMAIAWTAIGSSLQSTAEELAAMTGIELERVRAFLTFFSLGFGEADATGFSTGNNAVKVRPVLVDQAGTYLCISPGNLLFAIRPRLETVVKQTDKWERYQRDRAQYLETAAIAMLEAAIQPSIVYRNLAYRIGDRRYEIDGLLILDTVAVAVECKAAALTDTARRAQPSRLRDDLRKIIRDADDQSRRDREHILAGGTFEDTASRPVSIDLARIKRVFTITVTLEDLSALAPAGMELIDVGVLTATDECPLIVGLHELDLISDLVDLPALLIHYMHRRERSRHFGNVSAFDELDFFMYYLKHGLYLEEIFGGDDPPDGFRLLSFTDELDAYVRWKHGERRRPARKPRQDMPKEFEGLLRELEKARPPSYIDVSVMLMELSGNDRDRIARLLRSSRRKSAKDKQIHDFTQTYAGPPSYGITILTGVSAAVRSVSEKLEVYCHAKKYQTRRDVWIGFASLADDDDSLMHAYLYLDDPWQEDRELEEVVAALQLRPMEEPAG